MDPTTSQKSLDEMVFERLQLLQHANICEIEADKECTTPSCRDIKKVLSHMKTCFETEACSFPHCRSSAQILDHWNNCTEPNCLRCLPVKKVDKDLEPHAGTIEMRIKSIKRCIQALVFASWCKNDDCGLLSCHKMKKVCSHSKTCKKNPDECPICKQLIALCCYHAKQCQEAKCLVPFCRDIKSKIELKQIQEKLQKFPLFRLRLAGMFTPITATDTSSSSVPAIQNTSRSVNQMGQQQVDQRQHVFDPIQNNQESNSMESSYANNYQIMPQNQQIQQQNMINSMQLGNSQQRNMVPEMVQRPQNNPLKQALQQLKQMVRNLAGPDQKQQIIQMLKANPQLMAAFIRQRQSIKQSQQIQRGGQQ